MTEMTTYAPGTPCWVDLGTPDLDASVEFYGGLLGWDIPETENAEQTGGYRLALLNGKSTAGMMPLMQEGQPPAWMTYISVDDTDATAAAAGEAGGSVIAEPIDVMELGRMAVIADPEGAVFGIWQPGSFSGAELVNEPGSLSWNELNTRDPEAAESFYGDLFGWSFAEMDMGESGSYTTMHLPGAAEDDQGIAGLLDMRGRVPDEVPPHWTTYFTIADLDASLEAAKGAGGNVMFGPLELPMGRLALISDPQGVTFGLWQTLMSSE